MATLRLHAGDAMAAGRLLAEAGRRALVQGAAESAVTLLEQANDVLDGGGDATVRAHVLESLLYALAEAGLVERAFACASTLDHVGTGLDPRRRGLLHTRLAWAASIAGRTAEGLAQVDIARELLGPDAAAADIAPLDVVAAHLVLDLPGIDRLEASESMAWRAATVAQSVPLPVVACQAWQLLGALIRRRDLDVATACLERARSIAVEHQLPIWEIHALVRLGNDDALRHGGVDRLEQASKEAVRAGAVIASFQAEASIAMQAVLAGRFGDAGTLIDQVLASTIRLRLVETTQYTLLTRAILAAHQGRRREMDAALAEFGRWEGDESHHAPLTHGLAQTFCALLEERRSHAMEEMSRALCAEEENPTIFHLAGRHGLNLLLRVLSGSADWATYHAVAAEPASQLRWNRHFVLLTGAVLSGRSQQASDAASAMTEAAQVAAPFAMARHLGLRLVSESAIADGWGTPVPWLRTAEGYFHTAGVPAVASACRAMLRRAGVATSQRRTGAQAIPEALRSAGVTVREFEVLQLLQDRLGNREIASRLHLSPRTVEKHVASLIAKTCLPDRVALSRYAITLMTV